MHSRQPLQTWSPCASTPAPSSCRRIAVKHLLVDERKPSAVQSVPTLPIAPCVAPRGARAALRKQPRLLPRLAPAPAPAPPPPPPVPVSLGALTQRLSGSVSGSGSSSSSRELTLENDARRRKIELRKARNRESAQRSNFKRKMRLESLKKQLEMESRRASWLRDRERHLRQENHSLKLTMSASNC